MLPVLTDASRSDRRLASVCSGSLITKCVGDHAHADRPAAAPRLRHEMKRVEETGGELLIFDTAPHSDTAALEAAKVSDLILIPCRPAILDIEAISNTLDLVRTAGKPVYVVMNANPSQGHDAEEAAEAIAALDVQVCPVRLVSRVAFSRSLIAGQTAQEFEPHGKAAREIARLHNFMCAHIQIINIEQEGNGNHVQQVRHRA